MRDLPAFRGRLSYDAPLGDYTWFRVGGLADALASPADEDDLAYLLSRLPADVPVTVVGVGSNLIVRDGGVRGVVIRLGGRAFGSIETIADHRVSAAVRCPVRSEARERGRGERSTDRHHEQHHRELPQGEPRDGAPRRALFGSCGAPRHLNEFALMP